jgi:DNA-binding HxlR family transcriptional regulator
MKDHSSAVCPIAKVASLLSDTWTMLLLRDLMKKPMRFSELHESLEGISTRTLSLKLQKLEHDGIITKKEPLYMVTTKGKNLASIFGEMTKYGKKYLKK